MPKIKAYFVKPHSREEFPHPDMWTADDVVYADDFEKFKEKLDYYEPWSFDPRYSYPPTYEWTPSFPCSDAGYYDSISDEALCRSNHEYSMAAFNENAAHEVESGSSAQFSFDASDTFAIATAQKLEEEVARFDYIVLDEERMSELETELIQDAWNQGGRDDLLSVLSTMADEHFPILNEILDEEEEEIREEYREIVEPYLQQAPYDAHAYSGEVYFNYSPAVKDGYAWQRSERGTIKEWLENVTGSYLYFNELPKPEYPVPMAFTVEVFVNMIRQEKMRKDREEYEKFQSPIEGMEV